MKRYVRPWLAAFLYIAWYLLQIPDRWERDSFLVYQGSGHILDWLNGRAHAIGQVGSFPLFQYISGVAVLWANGHGIPINLFWVWATGSTLSLFGIIAIFHRVAARLDRVELGWMMTVVILSGPLVFYAPSTFNELTAAFLTVAFTAAVTGTRGPFVCAILFWLCGITKEVAPLLLVLIWVGGLGMRYSTLSRRQWMGQLVAAAIAILCTFAINGGFNVLRYGTVLNADNLLPFRFTYLWGHRLQYGVALWISPNGGVIPFWPTLAIVVVGVTSQALRRRLSFIPVAVVATVLSALTFGLSSWFGPFGWWSWGPRLMLPWLPSVLLILVRGYPEVCSHWAMRMLSSARGFALTAAMVLLFAMPHVLGAPKPQVVWDFFENDSRFPNGAEPEDMTAFYNRNVYLAWRKTPLMLFRPFIEDIDLSQILYSGAFLASLSILLWECREQLLSSFSLQKS